MSKLWCKCVHAFPRYRDCRFGIFDFESPCRYCFMLFLLLRVSGCPANCQACTYDGSSTRCLSGACDTGSYYDASTATCICESCLLTYTAGAHDYVVCSS